VFCTACGSESLRSSRYCAQCGAPLPESDWPAGAEATTVIPAAGLPPITGSGPEVDPDFSAAAHQGAVDALAPGSALLVVKRGPNAGSRFLLDQPVTSAGRHPDSDIFLDDVTVSRRHAEFHSADGGFAVRDVGSLNGTYVNRERVESGPLSGGDEVQIGKFRLVYLTGSARGGTGAGG